ncbi:trimeric intracellular cation channel family protein [Domibacillus aminovorans]|uniref:Glycine transporter domain-containing protein n=1 Tax=Domibacillus aminovorans TaxID=29332 RepID=A0A177L9W2_9BACI|nr:trimeric intracellular cation channel family protein [Domibacillus aminovorans]OAH62274.1 hypothetical protein AWH49_00640 [Domibacillus aminovorans]
MTWDVLTIIGTFAFAISGAIVAMEEEYDLFGIYVLGMITAFGGGAIRNLLIDVPVSTLWEQGEFFTIAILSITAIVLFPQNLLRYWPIWGNLFDAIGLSAFAIQGALYAVGMGHPLSAVVMAAVLTGSGGGLVRDVLAQRKPTLLRNEVYGVWAALAGMFIALNIVQSPAQIFILFLFITVLRILSYKYSWYLPKRTMKR